MNNINLSFLIWFALSIISFAQVSGKLTGIVKDNNGEPLVSANVIIEGTNLGAATDFNGRYTILNVRAGSYTVKIGYIGYKTQRIENVKISADQTKTLDVILEPEVIVGEEVVVVAKKPIVEFNQTSSVATIDKDDIKNLPVQSLNEIINLQAGVIDGHFRGGRLGEVQYQVDGVSVVNPYNNSSILEIDRSMIEEVQVISGTFDAKFGQAMSGVVNAVLKTGSEKFEVSGETYFGDYFTTDVSRYPNNNKFNPFNIQNYQLSISGPTGLPQTTFFINGRRFLSDSWIFGIRKFKPTDKNDFEKKIFTPTGDNQLVPMNYSYEWNGQFKLSNQSLKNFQFNYQATFNQSERKYYNHAFRINPDGTPKNFSTSLSHGLTVTHTISPMMFYKINFRQNYFNYESYVYKDLMDSRYLEAGQPKGDANYQDGAIIQGVDLGRFKQKTNSGVIKGDFTWQMDNVNLIEFGLEGQYSEITFGPPGFFVTTNVNGVEVLKPVYQFPRLPGLRNYYPKQFASYLQDRIELGDLVIRAGIRFEYFDAAAKIPNDLANPANTIPGAPLSKLVNTKVKTAIAPRLGFSFPLTASSSVYFSYGHFYQLPGLNLLYDNSDYSLLDQLQAGGISYGVMGNPDLQPEVTIQYEFGYKQALADYLGVQLSFFYKDIRNLLGVEFIDTYTAASYARFTNIDFGSVYGLTLSIFQRNLANFNTSLDYTLQFAQGNSSDPRETANRAASGMDPRPRDLPFNWDQRHTINLSSIYSIPNDYSISAIFRFGSGQPYTPEIGSGFGASQETNSGRKIPYFLLDLRAEKYFDFNFINFSVFTRIINVLNTHYVNGFVFNSTGSPDYTLTPSANKSALYDPARFYEPRRIEFGISFRSK
ncbi:MAG: TonB-dependent receptor [Ignavibacterium sp.]|nr:TonB-dependent receptor [Ignavibacterium sp.]MDW8376161.1 TonB-dependent receptor [Ignavibacteriales bacterium]